MNKDLLKCFSHYVSLVNAIVFIKKWSPDFTVYAIHDVTADFIDSLKNEIDISKITADEAKALSFIKWKSEDTLYLIPVYLVPIIPVGTKLRDINGNIFNYDGSNMDLNNCIHGCLSCGIDIFE